MSPSPGRAPRRWMWPKMTCSASMSSRSTTTCMASTPGPADLGDREVAVEAAEARPLHPAQRRRDHGRAEEAAAQGPRLAGCTADRLPDPQRPGAAVLVAAEAAPALGEAEDQVVDGRVDLLVVVRGLAPPGRPAGHPVDRGDREPLDRRQGHVAVEVVAVGGEDVVADPVAGVADLEPRVAEPVVDRLARPGGVRRRSRRARPAAPRRGRARATGRAAGGRDCRGRGSPRRPRTPRRSPRRTDCVVASDSPSGPSRSSTVSPSRTSRSAPAAAIASSSRSRIGARRSTSLPEIAPRCRSEIRTVVAIGQSFQLARSGVRITGNGWPSCPTGE